MYVILYGRTCFSTGNNTDVFSLQNYFKEQIYIVLEVLIVFLNPQSENQTNVLSNKNYLYMQLYCNVYLLIKQAS